MSGKKSFRCLVDLPGMKYTEGSKGKAKVWRTDNVTTHCCDTTPSLFVWEKSTKHNNYNGYSGYVASKYVHLMG